MEKLLTVIGTFSPGFPKMSSRLILLFTVTCSLPNYWCFMLRYFTCKQVPSLKTTHFSSMSTLSRENFDSCRPTQDSICCNVLLKVQIYTTFTKIVNFIQVFCDKNRETPGRTARSFTCHLNLQELQAQISCTVLYIDTQGKVYNLLWKICSNFYFFLYRL